MKKEYTSPKLLTQKFYVYIDKTADDNSKVFYVGKGNKARINLLKRNKKHTHIMNKYGINREIIFETFDEKKAFQTEIELIKKYDTYNPDNKDFSDFRANKTLGGEGLIGIKQTKETLALLTYIRRKNYHNSTKALEIRIKISENIKNKWKDPEYRKKMIESAKNRKPISEETRKKISENSKKQWKDPKFREKQKESQKNSGSKRKYKSKVNIKTLSEEQLLKDIDPKYIEYIEEYKQEKLESKSKTHSDKANLARSETMKKRWEDSEFKRKMIEKKLITNRTPEFRKKMSEVVKKRNKDNPEIIEKIKQTLRKSQLGHKLSDETKQKISKALKQYHKNKVKND